MSIKGVKAALEIVLSRLFFSFGVGEKGPISGGLIQGLSQDLETGCPKLAIVKFLGVQTFKGDHNIYTDFNHKHVLSLSK